MSGVFLFSQAASSAGSGLRSEACFPQAAAQDISQHGGVILIARLVWRARRILKNGVAGLFTERNQRRADCAALLAADDHSWAIGRRGRSGERLAGNG